MKDIKLIKGVYFNSPVIIGYASICFIMCILNYITVGVVNNIFACYHIGYQLITYIFVHGGIEHLFNNMLLLLLIGPNVEEKYGSKFLMIAMATTAIISGLANCILFNTGVLGASGIVFLLVVLSAFREIKDNKIALTTIIVVVLYLGREVLAGVLKYDDISQFGHIAGGICGIVWGCIYEKKFKKA